MATELKLRKRDLNDAHTEYIAHILIDNTVSFLFIPLFSLDFSQFHSANQIIISR